MPSNLAPSPGSACDSPVFVLTSSRSGIGRGVKVPVGALPEPMQADINQALDRLGYKQLGAGWNEVTGAFDPRFSVTAAASTPNGKASPPDGQPEAASTLRELDERLSLRTGTDLEAFAARWPGLQTDTLALVVDGDEPTERRWSLSDVSEPVATLIAAPGTWRSLLSGETNVVSELTSGRLRCVNKRDRYRLRSEELHALTWLLGLAHIPVERATAVAVAEAV